MFIGRKILTALFVSTASIVSTATAQQAVSSDAFVDSVGINIHLHYTETPYYTNFPLIQKSLANLGVRHLRDGLIDTTLQAYYDRLNALGDSGMKAILTVSPTQTEDLWESYPNRVSSVFEGYENPNEPDRLANWVPMLRKQMPNLREAAAGGAMPNSIVIGPSLTMQPSYPQLGNMSVDFKYGNMHNYLGNRNPGTPGWGDNGYGSIEYNMALVRQTAGSKSIYTTETGYTNDPTLQGHISESKAAVYFPRLLAEQWNAGVKRTYIYELLSEGGEDFGLMRADGTYKPAYRAVSNMLNLLADKGASFTPGSLDYTLNGADGNVHQLLLQKQDGTFYLALWLETCSYDPDKYVDIPVTPESILLQTTRKMSNVTAYQWNENGDVATSTLSDGTSIPLTISEKMTIVKLSAGTAAAPVNVTLASNVPGGWLSVDGVPISVGSTLSWKTGEKHSLSGWSPQSSRGSVYLFQNWVSGVTGSTDVAVQAPSVSTTYTGQFVKASSLNAYGNNGGTVTLSSPGQMWGSLPYFYPTDTVTATATPNQGCTLLNWAGDASSTSASVTVSMASSKNLIAVFSCAPATVKVTLTSNVPGGWISIDGNPLAVGTILNLKPGEKHTVSGWSPQASQGSVYLFQYWTSGTSGMGDMAVNIPTSDVTYRGQFIKGNSLNAYGSNGGKVLLSSPGLVWGSLPYYLPSQTVTVTAVPDSGYAFDHWAADSSATTQTIAVTMASSKNLIAVFRKQ